MNKSGQSLIEFSLIVILVILGIVTMGPYVLRSVNAHFKLWDYGVQDSFTENLGQSAILPNITSNCSCTPHQTACGAPGGGTLCGPNEMEWDYSCSPPGCNGASGDSYCVLDEANCCNTYYPQTCGTYSCATLGACPSGDTAPPTANNCYYGQEIMSTECSNKAIECKSNITGSTCFLPNCCNLPACQGILSPGAIYCTTGSITPPTGLLQNYSVSYVASCPDANPCAVQCDQSKGYVLNTQGTSCLEVFEVALTSCGQPGCSCSSFGWPASTTTNDCSFSGANAMCAGSTAVISSYNVKDLSSPTGCSSAGCGCNQPNGNPGERCQLTVVF